MNKKLSKYTRGSLKVCDLLLLRSVCLGTSRQMEYPEERYYKLNRFLLTLSGIWPYQRARNALIWRTLHTFIILSSLFVQAMSILTSEITIDYLMQVTQELLPAVGTLCNMYIRVMHLDKFKEIFDRIRNDWAFQKTNNEMKILHDYAGTSKSLTCRFTFLIYMGFVVYMLYLYMPDILDVISPINESRPRKHYFKIQYFVPEEQYISVIRLHIFVVLFCVAIVNLANITMFIAVTQHVCGMCELLGYRAKRLFYVIENTAGKCNLSGRAKLIYRNTVVFLRLHHNVIQYVGIIEHVYTIPFLMDLIGLVIVLSITLTQIFSISGNMELAIRSIGFANIQIIYMTLTNYIGQQIIDKSSDICDKVYNSAWYDAIVAQQKPLLLIMRRCFQPLMLTACRFYVMSLPNLAKILQTTVSYCMFMKQA